MRVKIKEKMNIPKLVYGKTYELRLATCEWYYRFKFTRKKNIYYKEINRGVNVTGEIKITKKNLKQLINSPEFTERVVEADYRPDILQALFGDIDKSVTDTAQLIKNKRYKVYLSRFYDEPSEIEIVEMGLETILNDLCNINLKINDITAIGVVNDDLQVEFQDCIGISLLNKYKCINGEAIRSIYIFLDY